MFILDEIIDAINLANHYDNLNDILCASEKNQAEYILKTIL
jgi:hypothetical protein